MNPNLTYKDIAKIGAKILTKIVIKKKLQIKRYLFLKKIGIKIGCKYFKKAYQLSQAKKLSQERVREIFNYKKKNKKKKI